MIRLFFLFMLFSMPVQAATVLVVGDSLSAGYGLNAKQGWVYLLGQKLGNKHKVINASISGDTTSAGLARLPQAIKNHKPDIIILELGSNDALRGLPFTQTQANLKKMIQLSKQAKAKVLLVGMDMPPNFGNSYRTQFKRIYQNLATEEKIALVPLLIDGFAADLSQFQNDGIHPKASAQDKMMLNVLPKLTPLL
ncbi:arylesterase [Neisseria sp. Ec49-e6-T10]|uniref:arylesterase n=1 Tax=Neisseria sp. Ec49-e6-T10 TaxID=3140744 RepID=UPI003EBE4F59